MNPINGSGVANTLVSTTSNLDGARRASGDTQGSGQSFQTELSAGVQTTEETTVAESTASANDTTAQVQVVTQAQETQASEPRGLIIDTTA